MSAAEDVGKEGNLMHRLRENFWMTPLLCDVWQCGSGSPALLSAVTWVLVLVDTAGDSKLLVQLKVVEDGILKLRTDGSEQVLGIQHKAQEPQVEKLNITAAKRQQEVKVVGHRDHVGAHTHQYLSYTSIFSPLFLYSPLSNK